MENDVIILKTIEYVKSRLANEGSGHDWWHIYRVYKLANMLGEIEKGNLFIIKLAALLHDIADHKFHDGNSEIGGNIARNWLKSLNIDDNNISEVVYIIETMSYKGGTVDSHQKTLEGMIVQDADRLDAIGAIGIGRAFAYGGFMRREMYNPDIKPQTFENFDQYKKSKTSTVNHFYEKLLKLKDIMNTETARKIAYERHQFMELFLNQFFKEWDCHD